MDYYHEPGAPAPTNRNPSASVAVLDTAGRLLLLRRTDNEPWTIPTGWLKYGETMVQCAVRECREEIGIEVEITGLVGVFSDPGHLVAYRKGRKTTEVRQPVNVCLRGRVIGGRVAPELGEAPESRWVERSELRDLPIHPAIRKRINHALDEAGKPYLE